MARVASGDDQAFEEIFDRYGPALLRFCTHMLGSRESGEDALQLTFVAAYKALRRGGCDGALRPWLYAIARNRCLSELRARREIPDSDRVSAERPAIDGPASQFARREQFREIVQDIQRLPADQRAALVLFELGDQSHEEIARVLGVRRDKVKALIFQAREGLSRGRTARETSCSEVRERLANERGKAPARGILRAHIDRCAPCQAFEREVRRQRAVLALVLPVALSGKLKVLVLSSALGHGSVAAGAAGVTGTGGTGGAGSLPGVTTAGSGSGVVAGSGSLGAGAGASATGSASTGVGAVAGAGAAAGSSAVSAAAGGAAPTMVASALGSDAVGGVGALTSSVSVASVAKLATVVAVAVGVGGVTRSALTPSPRPPGSVLAGQPAHPAPLRSPLRPLVSGIADPLAGATQPGAQPGVGAAAPAGAPPTVAASTVVPSSNAATSPFANPVAVSAPSAPDAGGPASPVGTSSTPAASAPGDGSATTTAPSSGSSTTTAGTTTTTGPSPTDSGTNPSTTTTASSPTTTPTGSSSGSSPSQGTSGGSSGTSGNGPGDSTGQGQPSGGDPGAGATHSNGNGPPITPPGCANNAAPGCAKKTPRS